MKVKTRVKKNTESRNSKLSKKFLRSFLFLAITIVILISNVLFFFFAENQMNTVQQYSLKQLEQVSTMTDLCYHSMEAIVNQVISNRYTYACLYDPRIDRLREHNACIALREIQASSSFTRYISFFNSSNMRFLSSSTVGTFTEDEAEYYYDLLGNSRDVWIMRKIGWNYATQEDKTADVYTFIYRLNLRPGKKNDLVIIDVNGSYFNSVLQGLRVGSGKQEIDLANRNGTVFSSVSVLQGSNDFAWKEKSRHSFNGILNAGQKSGYIRGNLGEMGDCFSIYSSGQDSGITIISNIPYSEITKTLIPVSVITLTAAVIALVLGTTLSERLSRKLYEPINALYRKFASSEGHVKREDELDELSHSFSEMYSKVDKLERGLITTYSDTRKLTVRKLLQGDYPDDEGFATMCEKLNIDIASPYYLLLLICADTESGKPLSDSNVFLSNYAMENVAKEVLLPFSAKAEFYRNTSNMLAILLPLRENKYPQGLAESLESILSVMKDEFGMETTVCIGPIAETYRNINMCYEVAKISVRSVSVSQHGKIFYAGKAAESVEANRYHINLHNKLAKLIQSGDIKACSKEFDFALSTLSDTSFSTAKIFFDHVAMSLLDDFSVSFHSNDAMSYDMLIQRVEEITRAKNVSILKKAMMDFILLLTQHLANTKKGSAIIETAVQYIDKNFSDPNLSLKMLADMANLSPAYFGKLFASVTNNSFNDYLSNIRMEKAAGLLANTKLPVNQISESVGIINTNYFYSVFKKRYCMTPLAYRNRKKK